MDRYYQLLDKDTSTITPLWKVTHILSFIVAIVSGFTAAYCLGKATESFGDNCVLFAKISFVDMNSTNNRHLHGLRAIPTGLKPIDVATSSWGSMDQCYFCEYTPMVSMIVAIIWCAMFLMCSKGGAGYATDVVYRPWRLVYPTMIFAAASAAVMLLSALQLNAGVEEFCAQFQSVFQTKRCTNQIDQYTLSFFSYENPLVVYLLIGVYCSYICFVGWVIQLATLVLRVLCIVDFQLIKITVMPKDDQEEIEQKVINLDHSTDDTLLSIEEETASLGTPQAGRKSFLFFGKRKPLGKKASSTKKGRKMTIPIELKPTRRPPTTSPKVAFDLDDEKEIGSVEPQYDEESLLQPSVNGAPRGQEEKAVEAKAASLATPETDDDESASPRRETATPTAPSRIFNSILNYYK